MTNYDVFGPDGPYRTPSTLTSACKEESYYERYGGYMWLLMCALCFLIGHCTHISTWHCANSNGNVETLRQNATTEAFRAGQLIWGVQPRSIYCRHEGIGTSCQQTYNRAAMLCDINMPTVGDIQMCCNSGPRGSNLGCVLRPFVIPRP